MPVMSRLRITHLTSAHPRGDVRVYHKMCRTLAAAGHEVSLIVADGLGDDVMDGVRVFDVGAPTGRANRVMSVPRKLRGLATALQPDVCHLHDPELLPAGLALKKAGFRVIFDSHEDVSKQIMSKHYLPGPLRRPAGVLWRKFFEDRICSQLDGVVAATPAIGDRFTDVARRLAVVRNYPLLTEFPSVTTRMSAGRVVCYLGAISTTRGLLELVDAVGLARSRPTLLLAGSCREPGLLEIARRKPFWSQVQEFGSLDRIGVAQLLGRAAVGMVTLHPTPNHLESLPIKMFEYMAAGLPIIASDFPVWRDIVDRFQCGLLVDPLDSASIARAIDRLLDDPATAYAMGERGRRAIEAELNWESEAAVLSELYATVCR